MKMDNSTIVLYFELIELTIIDIMNNLIYNCN